MGTNYYAIVRQWDPELTDVQRLNAEANGFVPDVGRAIENLLSRHAHAEERIEAALFSLQGWYARRIHIGKSSGGWCFSLCYNENLNLRSLEDWKRFLVRPEVVYVEDEYGSPISVDELLERITKRSWPNRDKNNLAPYYASWEDLLEKNHATEGPDGLLRHRVDGSRCVAHGEGTWDMIAGEFS